MIRSPTKDSRFFLPAQVKNLKGLHSKESEIWKAANIIKIDIIYTSRDLHHRVNVFSRGVNKAISHWVLQMFAIKMNSDRKWKRVAKRQTNLWKVADVFSVFDTILTTSLGTSN